MKDPNEEEREDQLNAARTRVAYRHPGFPAVTTEHIPDTHVDEKWSGFTKRNMLQLRDNFNQSFYDEAREAIMGVMFERRDAYIEGRTRDNTTKLEADRQAITILLKQDTEEEPDYEDTDGTGVESDNELSDSELETSYEDADGTGVESDDELLDSELEPDYEDADGAGVESDDELSDSELLNFTLAWLNLTKSDLLRWYQREHAEDGPEMDTREDL